MCACVVCCVCGEHVHRSFALTGSRLSEVVAVEVALEEPGANAFVGSMREVPFGEPMGKYRDVNIVSERACAMVDPEGGMDGREGGMEG